MAKAEKKTAALADRLEVLDAALVKSSGHNLTDLLAAVALKEFGVDLRRDLHPLEKVEA